ncbi:recombinase family protein [Mariniblastus sp.]|nr:recombinase family protein [Mariniblastus sp.]
MIVHSYSRFSDPSQEGGDSLRRQQAAAADFCKRKGWTLSDLTFADKGRSGFRGDKQRALNAFLKAVDDGKVKPGETLLVENVDRLSRKGIRQTQNLVNRLLDAGIDIAILTPVEKVYKSSDQNDIGGAIELAAYAFQAHVYSENLSNRIKAFNENRRDQVRNGSGKLLSSVCPSWFERLDDGEFKARPEAVRAIKYIFKRTIAGIGRKRLGQELNEKFAPLSKRKNSHSWNETMIGNIIKSRNVLGEVTSTVTGEVFKDYYPAVIDEKTWLLANAESAKRRTERGPSVQRVNLFNGMLYHAVDDCTMGFYSYSQKRKSGKVVKFHRYKSSLASDGVKGASTETVSVDVFEDLIFEFLPQLELKQKKDDKQAELTAKRDYLKAEIEAMQKQIVTHEVSASVLAGPLSEMAGQLSDVEESLKLVSSPSVAPTKSYRQKLSQMQRGTVKQRLLVRDRIRDIVERIDLLPIKLGPKRSDRVKSLLEIRFKTGDFVRAIELEDGGLVKVSGKTQQSLADQCRDGFRVSLEGYSRLAELSAKSGKRGAK